ncbi:MAG: hypothetical protein ABIF19_03860 [Planctomycetota bacterium]
MFKIKQILYTFCIFLSLAGSFCTAGEPAVSGGRSARTPVGLEDIWDPARYIGLDEIKPGMEAYCLTEYGPAGIEKFGLEVVDVVRDVEPGRDAILVQGTDERFVHTGPVAGCSGSPVYIGGRLAGALAFTWPYAKDPLYGTTPIEQMLRVGRGGSASSSQASAGQGGFAIDFSSPIDLAEVDRQFRAVLAGTGRGRGLAYRLPCPLITSGLPAEAREQLRTMVEPFGFMVVAGGGGGSANLASGERPRLVPGACLAVPLVSGDISMGTYGTATEVVDDKVYAFGHWLLGYGQIDLPMATGKVHTVVSNMVSSFKVASTLETVGALRNDEASGVVGQIGASPKMIPLTIRVDRFNDTQKRVYNCRLANNRLLTPLYMRVAVAGAALYLGDLPPDHLVEYKVAIGMEGGRSVAFENISSGLGLGELIVDSMSSVVLLMNNPYEEVGIESLDFDIRITPRNIISHIWSAELLDSTVKAGENIDIAVVLESVLAGKKRYQCRLEIPEDLASGKYELTVCGSRDYEQFLFKSVPQRFLVNSFADLVDALNGSLQIKKDKLYFLLTLPPGGMALEKAELPDLPATRQLVLQDSKRTLRMLPYSHWLERSLEPGTVVIDKKVLRVTVE